MPKPMSANLQLGERKERDRQERKERRERGEEEREEKREKKRIGERNIKQTTKTKQKER